LFADPYLHISLLHSLCISFFLLCLLCLWLSFSLSFPLILFR
jgi:hypothetical protein